MLVLWAMNLRASYESSSLLMGLNFIFSVLASLSIAYLIGRSFLIRGDPGLLMLSCGVVFWGVAGCVGIAAGLLNGAGRLDINIFITIHNIFVWLSALCHLAGVVISLRSKRTIRATNLWLVAGYAVVLGVVGLVTLSTLGGWIPTFFVQGEGGTLVRHLVLGSAMAIFILTAGLLQAANRRSSSSFVYWYTLALLLLAAGLFGIMIESVHASLLSWTGRAAQFLSGAYMFIAALVSTRESGARGITLGQALGETRRPYGVAIAIVIAAAALRLTFFQALGMHAPYVTFYPAVMFAALYGNLWAGFLATALSAALVNYFWIEPAGQFLLWEPADWLGMTIFLVGCAMISWIVEAMHRAQTRANAAEAEAKLAAEREQAAAAFRESEERMRLALQASSMGTFEVNLLTGEGRWNAVEFELLGLKPGDAPGNPETFFRFVHPDDVERLRAEWEKAMRTGQLDAEFRIVRADGQKRWLAGKGQFAFEGKAQGNNSKDKGQALRFLGVNFDITDRKQAEAKLRQTVEELARSNRDLEQFAYVASHDLKEPLRMVTGFTSLLKESYEGRLDAKADEYIRFAADAATRMQGLVNDLLAYARVGRDSAIESVDVAQAVDAALENLRAGIDESGATIVRDPLPTVQANAMELTQVFQKLIGNAMKFSREGVAPEVHIEAERMSGVRGQGSGVRSQGSGVRSQESGVRSQGSGCLKLEAGPADMTETESRMAIR